MCAYDATRVSPTKQRNRTDEPPLPDVATLSEEQLRGDACVYGCGPLRGAPDVVDLGIRPHPIGASYWFPRACLHSHSGKATS